MFECFAKSPQSQIDLHCTLYTVRQSLYLVVAVAVVESIRTWQVSRVIISMNYASIAHTVLALFHHFPRFISVSKLAQRRTTKTTTTKPTNSGQAADSDWNCVRGKRERKGDSKRERGAPDDDEQPYGQSRMWCAVWGERAKRWLYVLPSSMCSHVIAVKSTATTTTTIIIIPDNLNSTITAIKSRSRGEKETGRSVARTSASFLPSPFSTNELWWWWNEVYG